MGVNILPPDVRNSEYGFSIEEDKNKNESIRFGLFALKGVGEEIATSIPKERKKRSYEDIEEIIPAFKVKAVDTTAAGDTFLGALSSELKPDLSNLKDSVVYASKSSSFTVQKLGAFPSIPTRDVVEQALKEN